MKKILPFLIALFLITSCGKDDDKKDLTSLAVGVYHINGNETNGIITVNKKDNKTVTISILDRNNFLGHITMPFQEVILNNETSFSINQTVLTEEYLCSGSIKANGNGTVSSTSISIFLTLFDGQGPTGQPYSCLNANENLTYSATKQ